MIGSHSGALMRRCWADRKYNGVWSPREDGGGHGELRSGLSPGGRVRLFFCCYHEGTQRNVDLFNIRVCVWSRAVWTTSSLQWTQRQNGPASTQEVFFAFCCVSAVRSSVCASLLSKRDEYRLQVLLPGLEMRATERRHKEKVRRESPSLCWCLSALHAAVLLHCDDSLTTM